MSMYGLKNRPMLLAFNFPNIHVALSVLASFLSIFSFKYVNAETIPCPISDVSYTRIYDNTDEEVSYFFVVSRAK